MSRANEPLFPSLGTPNGEFSTAVGGLTIREHFAAMAMQGLLAANYQYTPAQLAEDAVMHADALLAELAKGPRHE